MKSIFSGHDLQLFLQEILIQFRILAFPDKLNGISQLFIELRSLEAKGCEGDDIISFSFIGVFHSPDQPASQAGAPVLFIHDQVVDMHFVIVRTAGNDAGDLSFAGFRGKTKAVIVQDYAILFSVPGKSFMNKIPDPGIFFIDSSDD